MSPRQARIAWGLIFGGICCVGVCLSIGKAQNTKTPAVETLLPASTVLYVEWDGNATHKKTWEQTAAHDALYKTGLIDAIQKFFSGLQPKGMPSDGGEAYEAIAKAFERVSDNGLVLSVSLPDGAGPPLPQLTLVLRKAANLQSGLSQLAENIVQAVGEKVEFQTKQVQSRSVTSGIVPVGLGGPPVEIGWWAEGEHLVLVAGINAVEGAIAVAAGDSPNLTANDVWKEQSGTQADFEVTTVGWFDFGSLRNKFGAMPLPPMGPDSPQRTVNDVLKALGLDTFEALVCRSGYKGRAMWSESQLIAPGPKRGLLALADQKAITMDDLPPLPFGTNGFYACSIDWSKLYEDLVVLVKGVAAFGPPDVAAQADGIVAALPQMIGFDLKADLFDALGNVVCVYGDTRQGFFGMGTGLVFKVDDAAKLRSTMDTILARATDAAGGKMKVIRANKQGREIILFEIQGRASVGGIVVDDNWLAIGLIPQTVEAFLLRLDKKLTVWTPTRSYQQGFAELPKEFTSIGSMDPRKSYRTLLGLAPILANVAMAGLKETGLASADAESPITLADIPPAEQVARPLFPNLCVCTVDDQGIRWTSRTSLPGIPFLAGVGGGSTVATTGVLVALLLPAVQQARTAARRAQSKNNLKQIALALHNYHDTFKQFPEGTHPNEKLQPDKRLSWLAKILPFVEQSALYDSIDFDKAWDDSANDQMMRSRIQAFLNPQVAEPSSKYAETHYVGIAGVGKDAPTLPVSDKRAGVFGYNRATRMRDIRDGTSNTMGVAEAGGNYGPWGAGGNATIRALTQKPYINGPDGIGGPYRGGLNVMMVDGSVRFVSEDIDPSVFEALSTISGGERGGRF